MAIPPPGYRTSVKLTIGGFNHASIYSGYASGSASVVACPGAVLATSPGLSINDVLLFSGAGRLDSVLTHQFSASSGFQQPVIFYDAAVPASSGAPIATSGHRLLGFVPGYLNAVSGLNTVVFLQPNYPANFGNPVELGVPFLSGLCASVNSGAAGFTVVWTPEVNTQ